MYRESWDGGYVPGKVEPIKLTLEPKKEIVPLKNPKEIADAKGELLKILSALSRSVSENEKGELEGKKAELVARLRASGQNI